MENVYLTVKLFEKIISGMFFTPESLIVLSVFALAGFGFWVKSVVEND